MNFLKKLFNKEETVEVKEEKKTEQPKVQKKSKPRPEISGKEAYRIEKAKRREAAQKKREEEAKIQAEKQKAENERIIKEREQKKIELEEQRARLKKEQEEKDKLANETVEYEKEEDALDLYGFEIKELSKGDIITVEILAEERDKFLCQSLTNFQDVLLPKIELEGLSVSVGDQVEVLIFKFYADEYYASVRRLANKRKLQEQLDSLSEDEIVNGRVISYNQPIFIVETENGIRGKVFIKNMDINYISEPRNYLEKNFDFIVKEKLEDQKNIHFELDRRSLLVKKQEQLLDTVAVGQIIEVQDYNFNKGGIEFTYNGIRGFIPISELAHKYYKNTDEAIHDFTEETIRLQIKEIQKTKSNQLNLLGSIKALTKSPWEELEEKISVGDKITGEVTKIEKYGLFINVHDTISGLLHNSEYSPQLASEVKNIKLGDELEVIIKDIDLSSKKIALTQLIQEKEEE